MKSFVFPAAALAANLKGGHAHEYEYQPIEVAAPDLKVVMPPKWPILGFVVDPIWEQELHRLKEMKEDFELPSIPGAVISKNIRIQPIYSEVELPELPEFEWPEVPSYSKHAFELIGEKLQLPKEKLETFVHGGIIDQADLQQYTKFLKFNEYLKPVFGKFEDAYHHMAGTVHEGIKHVADGVSDAIDAKDALNWENDWEIVKTPIGW